MVKRVNKFILLAVFIISISVASVIITSNMKSSPAPAPIVSTYPNYSSTTSSTTTPETTTTANNITVVTSISYNTTTSAPVNYANNTINITELFLWKNIAPFIKNSSIIIENSNASNKVVILFNLESPLLFNLSSNFTTALYNILQNKSYAVYVVPIALSSNASYNIEVLQEVYDNYGINAFIEVVNKLLQAEASTFNTTHNPFAFVNASEIAYSLNYKVPAISQIRVYAPPVLLAPQTRMAEFVPIVLYYKANSQLPDIVPIFIFSRS